MAKYIDPILEKYVSLIKANNQEIKNFYYGDPVNLSLSEMPVLIISKFRTNVRQITNSQDEHEAVIRIIIATDIRSELSTQSDFLVAGLAKLYDIVEGRNSDFSLKSSSILDILRTNQIVDETNNLRTDLRNFTKIEYGEALRDRENNGFSTECVIEFVANFIQIR